MAQRTTKFEFYEKVVVLSTDPELAEINGQLAAIVGKAIDDHGTLFGYAVNIYATGECWSVKEGDLSATGEFDKRESFYSGESIRVSEHGVIADEG